MIIYTKVEDIPKEKYLTSQQIYLQRNDVTPRLLEMITPKAQVKPDNGNQGYDLYEVQSIYQEIEKMKFLKTYAC